MNLRFDYTGRTAVVTGAAQGIGLAIADLFLRSGGHVVAVDRDGGALAAAWEARAEVLCIAADVADVSAITTAVARAAEWAGAIDVLVNNAGITRDSIVWKLTDDDWRAVIDVHLTGTFVCTRAVLPHMRAAGYGRIINVTSYTGLHGNVGQANYAAAKAGVIGFTKTVAKEVARSGITVNAISPNAATAMVAAVPAAKKEELEAMVPQGRFAAPEEMAAAVAFLASEEAGYITGVVLPVDGGLSM